MSLKQSSDKGRLYFAYGSNLSTAQMRDRCPNSTPIGLAHLTGWTWIINERGYANVVPSPKTTTGAGVYGLVYRLHPSDERQLDICEGVGYAYEREMLEVAWAPTSDQKATQGSQSSAAGSSSGARPKQPKGKTGAQDDEESTLPVPGRKFEALVYVDSLRVTPSGPKQEYVGRMNVGIKEASEDWGLPTSYVDDVMRPFIPARGYSGQAAQGPATGKKR
ncbi:hypothetical protein GGR51DRAFT_558789 [Nemania sp. FL0031]|nr:hypothetical protein GGR51DRAFT_558789 [Nemania sp. FL0031]